MTQEQVIPAISRTIAQLEEFFRAIEPIGAVTMISLTLLGVVAVHKTMKLAYGGSK